MNLNSWIFFFYLELKDSGIKILEEENASMKLLLNDDEENVWQNISKTIKLRDIPSTLNFISTSSFKVSFSPLQQLQIDDTHISHISQMPSTTAAPSLQTSPKNHPKHHHQNVNLHQFYPHSHLDNDLHIPDNCSLLNNTNLQQFHLYHSNLDHDQFQHKQ